MGDDGMRRVDIEDILKSVEYEEEMRWEADRLMAIIQMAVHPLRKNSLVVEG